MAKARQRVWGPEQTMLESISENTALLLTLGIGGLLLGAFAVSQGASLVIQRWNVSPTLLGLFLSFAATLPELAVTLQSLGPRLLLDLPTDQAVFVALKGTQLPIGLILGSTLINLMVLSAIGACFLSLFQGRKLLATKRLLGRDLLTLVIAIGLILWFALRAYATDGTTGAGQPDYVYDFREYFTAFASFLLAGAAIYVIIGLLIEFVSGAVDSEDAMFGLSGAGSANVVLIAFLIIGGSLFLYGASWILVERVDQFVSFVYGTNVNAGSGIVAMEDRADYAKFGLFVVAAAVAAPELIMMFANVLRRDSASMALTIGTLIGSSIFNLLLVFGIALLATAQGDLIHVFNLSPFNGDLIFLAVGIVTLAVFLINDLWDKEDHGILSVPEAATLIALYVVYAFYRNDFFADRYDAACKSTGIIGSACQGLTSFWQWLT